MAKIEAVVCDATMRSELASGRELSKRGLVVEAAAARAAGRVFRPLKLADEPIDWQPPVLLEGDDSRSPVRILIFNFEDGDGVDVDVVAWASRWMAGAHIVGGRIQDGGLAHVLHNGVVVGSWSGHDFGLGWARGEGRASDNKRGTLRRRWREDIAIKVDRLEVERFVVGVGGGSRAAS